MFSGNTLNYLLISLLILLPDIDYSSVLMGILVIQDIILGIIIAVLPNMASHKVIEHNTLFSFFQLINFFDDC